MSPLRQFAIRNELLYSGFVLPNVQIFFVQKISFATFGVSINDFLRDTLVWATAYIQTIDILKVLLVCIKSLVCGV